MADQIIDIPGVGPVAFPSDMNEDALRAAVQNVHRQGQEAVSRQQSGLGEGTPWGKLAAVAGAPAAIALAGPHVGRVASTFSPSGAALGAGEALLHQNRSLPRVLAGAALGGFGGGLVKRGATVAGEALGTGIRTGMAPVAQVATPQAMTLGAQVGRLITTPAEAAAEEAALALAKRRAAQQGLLSAGRSGLIGGR